MERTHVSGHRGPTAIIGCYWMIAKARGVGELHAVGGAVLSRPHWTAGHTLCPLGFTRVQGDHPFLHERRKRSAVGAL